MRSQLAPSQHHGSLYSSLSWPWARSITIRRIISGRATLNDLSKYHSIFLDRGTSCSGMLASPVQAVTTSSANTLNSSPNLDSIQALLIVAFVLLNDMKAEASWALIGMTCRLSQSLGLHRAIASDEHTTTEMSLKSFARRKLWYTPLNYLTFYYMLTDLD